MTPTPLLNKKDVEETAEDAQHLLEFWLKFKKFLMKSFTQEPISMEDESEFLETKSKIAKFQRMVGEKVKDIFYYGADKIQSLTRACISISHLRSLPMVDRRNLLVEWHKVYVIVTKLAGALHFVKEGYVLKAKVKAGTSIAAVKAGANVDKGKGKKKDMGSIIKFIIIFAVLAGAILFFLKRAGKI